MILNLQRETLIKPLQIAAGVVKPNQTLPILSNVLIKIENGDISVTGTDLEIQLVGKNKLVHQNPDQELTLPAKKLMDICKALPAEATIELMRDKNQININSGKSSFSLATLPAQKFPSVEGNAPQIQLTLAQAQFKLMLHRTAFAMAQNDVRYYLNGILLEITDSTIKAVATDGHRLAINSIEITANPDKKLQLIIPHKAVSELIRLLDQSNDSIELIVGTNFIKVFHPSFTFTSKLIEGTYPDYQRVIPKNSNKQIPINRLLLKDALSRASILCDEKFRGIKFEFRNNLMLLHANNPEHEEAEEIIAIEYPYEDLDICFNVTYLIENLNTLESDTIILNLSDATNSLLIEEPGNNFSSLFVVMPMRI